MMPWATREQRQSITGVAMVDRKTKQLIKRINPGQIAVIHHRDIDEVAAEGLVQKKVRAVINGAKSISGIYPTPVPARLLAAGIPILDGVGEEVLSRLEDEDPVWIEGEQFGTLDPDGKRIQLGQGERLTPKKMKSRIQQANANLEHTLEHFIDNTLLYAKQEKSFVTQPLAIPDLRTPIKGQHVVVVVRGAGYRQDLRAIRSYIDEVRPVLLAVDGGADALLECGLTPDLIVGDMDSISDRALATGAEVIVHAYPDGRAPGEERVKRLGIPAHIIPAIGTSEDVAMLLAFQEEAELIVAVGTHSNMVDFLEKGRQGMASTLLVRMKIGTHLVDAKGVSKLYRSRVRWSEFSLLSVAALFPIIALAAINPDIRHAFRLLWLNLKMFFH